MPLLPHLPRFLDAAQLAMVLATFCAGCASPYWQNRRADAADVFTATVGVGMGAAARIGPLNGGLGIMADLYGQRGGESGNFGQTPENLPTSLSAVTICYSYEWFLPQRDEAQTERAMARGKVHHSEWPGAGFPVPFVDPPVDFISQKVARGHPQWTQIDLSVGLIGGARLGFNPGELLDFILGFFGVDIYGDDLEGAQEEHGSSVLDLAHDLDKQILAKLEPHAEVAEPGPHAESAEDAE